MGRGRLKKKRKRTEQTFKYRIKDILESLGYLVIVCARSKPFDLVALKDNRTYLIEVKGRNTRYPEEQKKIQCQLASKSRQNFILIKQDRVKGHILINCFHFVNMFDIIVLEHDLKKVLNNKLHVNIIER